MFVYLDQGLKEYHYKLNRTVLNYISEDTKLIDLQWDNGGRIRIKNILDKIADGRKYELLRFSLPFQIFGQDDPRLATYLKMINPSTGETCVEGVPNNAKNSWSNDVTMNTVKEALAWRDGDPDNIYLEPVALT